MSWSRRSLLAALAVAGCGFAPVHQPDTGGRHLGLFAITAPQTPLGAHLLARLEDRLGPPNAARYDLSVTVTVDEAISVITADQETQRYSLVGQAQWRVTAPGGAQQTGTVDSFASYSASGTTVATEAARLDAEQRLAEALADRIVTRVRMAVR